MLKDRDKLDRQLRLYLSKYYADKKVTDKIKEIMLEKGWNLGEITNVINLTSPIEGLSEEDSCLLSKAITCAIPNSINYKEYWNEKEIERMERKIKVKKEKENTLIFSNIVEGIRDENKDIKYFVCPMYSIYELQEAFQENHLIGYDESLQRELTRKVEKEGEITAKIERDPRKISAICDRMLKNEFYPTQLVLYVRSKNAFADISKNFQIDNEKHILEIKLNEDIEVLNIDGYSRMLGASNAVTLNKTLNRKLNTYFSVIIGLWNDEEAGDFIKQINEQTPFNFNKIEVIGSKNNPAMNITKAVNNSMNAMNNSLYHKFAETENDLAINKEKLCLFNTFAKAIEYNFAKKKKLEEFEPKELQDLTDYLIKGFNEILYDIKSLSLNIDLSLSSNAFIGYIALLAKWQDDEKWKEKIQDTLNNIEFEDEEQMKKISFFTKIINNTMIKKISNYFIERSINTNEHEN